MPSLRTEGVILVVRDRTMENGDCATSPLALSKTPVEEEGQHHLNVEMNAMRVA